MERVLKEERIFIFVDDRYPVTRYVEVHSSKDYMKALSFYQEVVSDLMGVITEGVTESITGAPPIAPDVWLKARDDDRFAVWIAEPVFVTHQLRVIETNSGSPQLAIAINTLTPCRIDFDPQKGYCWEFLGVTSPEPLKTQGEAIVSLIAYLAESH
jgi:hypothetical protein